MKTIWLFGPSGAGKTTVGNELVEKLRARGRDVVMIDGDELRRTVCFDLGFSYDDRFKQTTRAAYMAKAVTAGNAWAIVCLITPYKEFRDVATRLCGPELVYLQSSQEERVRRDPKGLYAKAIAGELEAKLTGYDGAFDVPDESECMTVTTEDYAAATVADIILSRVIGESFTKGGGI